MISDFDLGITIYYYFTTRTNAGVPVTFSGSGTEPPAVEVYESGSVTQITTADTLTVDYDGVTGLNEIQIAVTSGNGFEKGKFYAVVVSSGTVSGNSVVGETILNFSVGLRYGGVTDPLGG
jgi:uncharacterized protein YraI